MLFGVQNIFHFWRLRIFSSLARSLHNFGGFSNGKHFRDRAGCAVENSFQFTHHNKSYGRQLMSNIRHDDTL